MGGTLRAETDTDIGSYDVEYPGHGCKLRTVPDYFARKLLSLERPGRSSIKAVTAPWRRRGTRATTLDMSTTGRTPFADLTQS